MNGYPARRTVFGGFSGADSRSRLLRVLHAARWVHAPSCHGLVRPPVVLGVAYVQRPSRFEARDVQKRAKHAMFVDVDFVQAFSEPLACARGLIGNFVNAFQRLSAVVREVNFLFYRRCRNGGREVYRELTIFLGIARCGSQRGDVERRTYPARQTMHSEEVLEQRSALLGLDSIEDESSNCGRKTSEQPDEFQLPVRMHTCMPKSSCPRSWTENYTSSIIRVIPVISGKAQNRSVNLDTGGNWGEDESELLF